MKLYPTGKMRWLVIRADELGSRHPTAFHIADTNNFRVLQQWMVPGNPFEDWDWKLDDSGEWQDVPLEWEA